MGIPLTFRYALSARATIHHEVSAILTLHQDLVSRFTLDSATTFLFGQDVHSLSAGLPYPAYSPLANAPAFVNHPSNVFVNAFIAGQSRTALRSRYGPNWPLIEFWKDQVKCNRKVVDSFVEPILRDAIQKRKARNGLINQQVAKKGGEEAETLLDHLVEHTDG